MNDLIFRINYGLRYWKLLVHLAFGTFYFGVNNSLWSKYPSIFGRSGIWNIKRFLTSLKMMKARCFMGFIPLGDAKRLFPDYARKQGFV